MAQSSISLNGNNDGKRYDWRINHEGIRQTILDTLKSEKRFPTYKEISVATGLSIETICQHAKSLDLVEIRTQAKLLGPDILLRQALKALNTGDHNATKTYFKLNYDWTEKTDVNVSGSIQHNLTGKRLAEIRDEELPEVEKALLEKRLLLQGNMIVLNPDFIEAEFEDGNTAPDSDLP